MKEIFQARYSKDWLWLGLIVCAGITLRILAIINYDHVPTVGDELAYKSMALNFLGGSGIIDHMGNYAMFNMGYPFFILVPVFFLFGEENIVAVQLGNLFLGVIAIILCYEVAKEAGAGRLGRLVAAAIWALYLPASVYTVYFAKEHLMIPLMLGVIWCAFRLTKQPSTKTIIGCGVLFGLLALTGNAALCLVATVVASLFFLSPALRFEKVRLFLILIVVTFAVTSLWMIRNMHTIGAPILNTNGGFNLYLGNNPVATGWFVSIADTPRGETWSELRKIGEVEASNTLKHEAISWIKEHPSDFISLAFRKATYFWAPPLHDGKGEQTATEKSIRILWAIQFLILVVTALSTLVIKKLRNRQLFILWLSIAVYTAVHMLFYVIFRYRFPIMPVVSITAALAVESLLLDKSMLFIRVFKKTKEPSNNII